MLFNFGLDKLWEYDVTNMNCDLINEFNAMFSKYNYSKTLTTLDLFERTTPLNMETSNEVSSSHVVRCDLKMNDIETLLEKIRNNKISYEDQYED